MEKTMNFDEAVERKGTNCVKHDDLIAKFGVEDVLPLWVADMDLPTSPAIIDAIKHRANHPIFGYSFYSPAYYLSIVDWYSSRHSYNIESKEIIPINNIASAVAVALEIFSEVGDGVLIQTPLYPPFRESIVRHERVVVENRLLLIDGRYEIDWADFEQKAKQAKLFLFCSPHNPTGRVWSKDELTKMVQICKHNGVLIVSDEIHSDLTHNGYKHIPIASLGYMDIITLNSPAKRFNIPSIAGAFAIIKEDNLREKFMNATMRYAPHTSSPIIEDITIAAYRDSLVWLKEVDRYLLDNLHYISKNIMKLTKIKPITPEASFLLWLDCRDLDISHSELVKLFVNELKLGLNSGVDFGKNGSGFMRLNYATSRATLVRAMEGIDRIINVDN